jgi:hypothetical protein
MRSNSGCWTGTWSSSAAARVVTEEAIRPPAVRVVGDVVDLHGRSRVAETGDADRTDPSRY